MVRGYDHGVGGGSSRVTLIDGFWMVSGGADGCCFRQWRSLGDEGLLSGVSGFQNVLQVACFGGFRSRYGG